jgi:hypothetical protein
VLSTSNPHVYEYEVTLIDRDEDIECEPILLREHEVRAFEAHSIDLKAAPPSLLDAYHRAITEYGQSNPKKTHEKEPPKHHLLINLGLEKPKQLKNLLWSLCLCCKTIALDEETIEALKTVPLQKKHARQYWQQ